MKQSIFNENSKVLKQELIRAGINNKMLCHYPTLYFYVNTKDTSDYCIKTEYTEKQGYAVDCLPTYVNGTEFNISDIIYYVKHQLAEYLFEKAYAMA